MLARPLVAVLRHPALRAPSLALLGALGCRSGEAAPLQAAPPVVEIPARSASAPPACSPAPESPVGPPIAPAPAPPVARSIDPSVVASALARIPTLGTRADADPPASVEALHAAGRAAVPLLVGELRVIDPDAFDDRAMHAIWCIRALRSLTGQDFWFRTTLPLSPRSATFLDAKRPMGFFAEWMSHARIYVAPADVQRKVIEAWKGWALARTETFPVQAFVPFGDWYF